MTPDPLQIAHLGRQAYVPVWKAMSAYTDERTADTPDQLWLVEHDPVFTQGQAGKAEHLLAPGDIPVVQAAVVMFSLLFVLLNLIVDVVYTRLDPRIRLG